MRKSSPAISRADSRPRSSLRAAGRPRRPATLSTPEVADVPIAEWERRSNIIEERHLRQEVSRLEALRREHPDLWRETEARRRARNREQAVLNRRLRAAGCRPLSPEPSLRDKLQKLQRLEERNRAEIERFRKTK